MHRARDEEENEGQDNNSNNGSQVSCLLPLPLHSLSHDDDVDSTKPLLVNNTNSASKVFKDELLSRRIKLHQKNEKKQLGIFHGSFGLPDGSTGKVLILGLALCLILASFWLMDSLKDATLAELVGMEYQPTAKLLSVLSTLLLVTWMEYGMGRARSNSHESKNKTSIFYVVGLPYFLLFTIIASCLREYENSKPNQSDIDGSTMDDGDDVIGSWRLLGFLIYVAIESYGSIMVATFWAYTNETLDLETAKQSYGIIVAIAQVGAITGSSIATSANFLGLPMLFNIGAIGILAALSVISVHSAIYSPIKSISPTFQYSASDSSMDEVSFSDESDSSEKNSASGIHLILRYNYLLLILGLSCLYEIVLTVMDYEMKLIGLSFIDQPTDGASSSERFAEVMGRFGIATNCVSLIMSFFGFGYLMQKLGLRITLRVYPSLLVVGVFLSFLLPNFWTLFVVMAILKATIYSIFDPCKEILYVPTSSAVKFKAKFWIDVVGARCAKALGSSINELSNADTHQLIQYGWIPSVSISLLLLLVSIMAGKEFEDIVSRGYVVGEEEIDTSGTIDKPTYSTELRQYDYNEAEGKERQGNSPHSISANTDVLTI